ncbi:MAG TPA: hypothetical protein VK147_11845 [Candidatus Didemnitutus sp.]|nr:hypothetical protein [Candidatus Didemnitutus sp.]
MKSIVSIIVVVFVVFACREQGTKNAVAIPKVISLAIADTFLLKRLDTMYTSAVSIDTADRVFVTAEDEARLSERWIEFHNQFASYLRSKDLHSEKMGQTFITLYCSKNGSVDHASYAFIDPIDSLTERRYTYHLEEFIRNHGLDIVASKPYSQCGSVKY